MSRERDLLNSSSPTPLESSSSPEAPQDIPIEINTSQYIISKEAQKYLTPVAIRSEYEKDRSVLIIQEAHNSTEGQYNLFRFLEIFFQENPKLASRTIFLAEGYPANKPLSVAELIQVAPKPTAELIWETLSTFLITGYMAYEWKHQRGIPIIGTEDPVIYGLGSRFMAKQTPETMPLVELAGATRNKSIANTLIAQINNYGNPILFVGDGHLSGQLTAEEIKEIQVKNLISLLTPEELASLQRAENFGIHYYLQQAKIGYNFFFPAQALNPHSSSPLEQELYMRLYLAQQHGNYDNYIDWLVSQKFGRTTTSPSPGAAAKFVKAYLAKNPGTPDTTLTREQGISLRSKGKFTEAAKHYSAASTGTKGPNISGYTGDIQESLFKEIKARFIRVAKDPSRIKAINPDVPSDIPISGPRIEKDYLDQVGHFDQRFSGIPGRQEVIDNAMHTEWKIKYGGIFQIKTAEVIGPERIRAFEERHQLPGDSTNRIDIATNDNIAVECKNFRRPTDRDVDLWLNQAVRRFEPSVSGHTYRATIITIPESISDKDFKHIESTFKLYLKLDSPQFSGKIWLCRLNNLQNTLNKVKK